MGFGSESEIGSAISFASWMLVVGADGREEVELVDIEMMIFILVEHRMLSLPRRGQL